DFSGLRFEPEVKLITAAFENMLSNIREYTVLLERYKHSVDESAIVVRMDVQGRVTYVNDEFCRLSGYSSDEVLGASIFVICHAGAEQRQCNDIFEYVLSKKIWKGNIQNHRKNGSVYYVRATVVPILDEQENIIELISIQQDITQVIEQQAQIVRQTMDPVTGLYNRVKLEEDVVHIDHPEFAIISLDNYNVIKDYYGWESGRKILKEVADLFLKVAGENNLVAYKLAGSDYALMGRDGIGIDKFHEICRGLLKEINNCPIQLDEGALNIGASAGLTTDKEHFLSYAGLALKHAQETRHRTIIYEETENLVQRFENNLFWTKKLNFALNDGRIALYVQPILNSKSLEVCRYECLVRMIDEDGKGVIPPLLFLDIAKESKLYHQLTEKILSIAFDIFSKVPDVEFSVNLTIDDLLHVPTVLLLKSKLDESDLAARMMIEIVESEGIENFQEVSEFVADMKARGCKIAIDDFGSGYSNFAYLMQLQVDCIKIDGSLIKKIDQDRNSQIITSTILDFSKQLGIETVAEFVHSPAVLSYTQDIGIDYVQGFYLGEPVPIESLII
ncbi:MAG: EAL domain-containing protein, partial [Gammaproteobacteria bacterium]|nr:EAL domain-containing protein [Gammaproteobacteria bacterium]